MTHRSDRIDATVAKLDPVADEELTSLSQSPAAQALFEEVVSVQPNETNNEERGALGARHPHWRSRLAWACAAGVVVAAAVLGIALTLHNPAPAAAAVEFRTSGNYIVAIVVNPYAATQQLDAAFAAYGLDITLKLVPVSPSLVGGVVYMDEPSGASAIETLPSSTREAPGGPLQVGLRIPIDFKGHADIDLGRAARPGEAYVSTGDAFAPGEALYKSGLLGMRVSAAELKLKALGLSAEWRDERLTGGAGVGLPTPVASATASPGTAASPTPATSSSPTPTSGESVTVSPQQIPNNWVTGAVPLAPGKVLIFTQAQKPSQQ